MDNDRFLWDKFWGNKKDVPIFEDPPETWYQLIWQEGFKFWDGVFKVAKGKKTLECGCGSAKVSTYLAKHGFDAVMLDSSEEALKLAKINFNNLNLKGSFICSDVESLGLQKNSFDIVMSFGLLEHFPDVRGAIREMIRVLKPNGLFVADIITKKFSVQSLADIEIFWARFLKRLLLFKFKNIINESRKRNLFYENSVSKSKYQEIMVEEGLKDVKITGTRPFPYLLLPAPAEKIYVKMQQSMLSLWRDFDRSKSRFTDIWGLGWHAQGIKR